MSIIRRSKDPRSPAQRRVDESLLDRFGRGEALRIPEGDVKEAVRRVSARNAERRLRVATLGTRLAELRMVFGLTQQDVARAIGTSKPNVSAMERGRAPGISLERFLAVLEALESGAFSKAPHTTGLHNSFLSPTHGFRTPMNCLKDVA